MREKSEGKTERRERREVFEREREKMKHKE